MKSFIRSMYDMKKFFIDKYALGNLESIEEDMNNALMSYAILLNAKDEAVQIYHERRSFLSVRFSNMYCVKCPWHPYINSI